MRIYCEHGFYVFEPEGIDDQANFEANTGHKLVRLGGGLTFAPLTNLPALSIKGQPYGNLTAKVNYCGNPAQVMRANGFVFDTQTKELVEVDKVKATLDLYPQINGGYVALEALPQAGAVYNRQKLISFTGVARWNNRQFILRTYEFQNQSN